MKPINTLFVVAADDQKRVAKFKALLLTTFIVASFGQLAVGLMPVFPTDSALFFPCAMVFGVSIAAQILILPAAALYFARKAAKETKCPYWFLCGLLFFALQAAFVCVQSLQTRGFLRAHQAGCIGAPIR